jgi:death-on-curing protein
MTGWRWVNLELVYAVHDRQISEHGGLDGLRDRGAVESALERPQNKFAFSKPDAADLAAAYAFGLSRGHGFLDGNKRIAWVIARLFLADNGYRLAFEPTDAVRVMEELAAGKLDEKQLAEWFRTRLTSSAG